MELLTSRGNSRIMELESLLKRKKSREPALFACEGARLCEDAVRAGLVPQAVYLTEKAQTRYPGAAALLIKTAHTSYTLCETLAERISDTENPQGVFAVFKRLDNHAQVVKIVRDGKYLLLAGLQDPGNVGTILRTAEAFGLDGVFFDENCPDLYAPKVLRASMGGVFRLKHERCDMYAAIAMLRENKVPVYAAAMTADAVPLHAGFLAGGAAVLIGNEGAGLPDDLISCCTSSCIIPMPGTAESLNAATAAAIFAWEMRK